MPLIRERPIAQPDFDLFVLLDDGSGDLWWVDDDGDLLFWDQEGPPAEGLFEIRKTDVKLADVEDNDVIERAFRESEPSTFDWIAWLAGL